MNTDLRQAIDGTKVPDPPTNEPTGSAYRRRLLKTYVAARDAKDHQLAVRLLKELVELTEAEKREVENG